MDIFLWERGCGQFVDKVIHKAVDIFLWITLSTALWISFSFVLVDSYKSLQKSN